MVDQQVWLNLSWSALLPSVVLSPSTDKHTTHTPHPPTHPESRPQVHRHVHTQSHTEKSHRYRCRHLYPLWKARHPHYFLNPNISHRENLGLSSKLSSGGLKSPQVCISERLLFPVSAADCVNAGEWAFRDSGTWQTSVGFSGFSGNFQKFLLLIEPKAIKFCLLHIRSLKTFFLTPRLQM